MSGDYRQTVIDINTPLKQIYLGKLYAYSIIYDIDWEPSFPQRMVWKMLGWKYESLHNR